MDERVEVATWVGHESLGLYSHLCRKKQQKNLKGGWSVSNRWILVYTISSRFFGGNKTACRFSIRFWFLELMTRLVEFSWEALSGFTTILVLVMLPFCLW